MNRGYFRILTTGLLVLAALLVISRADRAEAAARYRTPPNLFYNYYVPPVGHPGVGAQLYVSPRPTPPMVGHTYVTYEALMPHEFLWKHHRVYWRYHPDGKRTRVQVCWE